MNWHSGNIAEAVATSKLRNAVFVVFIEGQDEMSSKLERFVDDIRVRSLLETPDFVSIKVKGNSSAYGQFLSLYKVVPVPSLFFIGKSGTPLEIATGVTACVEEVVAKIEKVLVLAGKRPAEPLNEDPAEDFEDNTIRSIAGSDDHPGPAGNSAVGAASSPNTTNYAQLDEDDTSLSSGANDIGNVPANPDPPRSSSSSPSNNTEAAFESSSTVEVPSSSGPSVGDVVAAAVLPSVPLLSPVLQATSSVDARIMEVKMRIEQKRREREEEENQRETENEMRRRRASRDSQSQQQLTKEQEIRNMQALLKRERQEEQVARDRIRAQIAADRMEQARRSTMASEPIPPLPSAQSTYPGYTIESPASSVEETRLQIRLPGGVQRTKSFPAGDVLATVRVYVRGEMLAISDSRDFTLATSYPRYEFQTEDDKKTLHELNLVPNAVVLVLTKDSVNRVARSSLGTMLATVMWAILTPAAKAIDYIHKMGLRPLTQRISVILTSFWAGQRGNVVDDIPAQRRNMDVFPLRPRPAPGLRFEEVRDTSATHDATPTTAEGPGSGGKPVPQTQEGSGTNLHVHSATQAHSTSQEQSQQFQQRPGGYRYGGPNIRRLQDTDKEDNDKDKATYNGNSTQQQ
ncbi:hypothetical protein KR018_010178 [Drosophila ironensis]|nr:hypothetical protein KR018_010178 [Drosophila ironensis]